MKIYTTSEMFFLKLKNFFAVLPGALLVSAIGIALILMCISDDICKSICSDVLAFGLAALAGRVGYIIAKEQYEKENKKHKHQQRASKRSA